ncbi:MAG: enoyl-CoA hydratase/isomerase family protein [Alphaproteobacteria bacterium]|nr:enoyl-CoA hydratase/isomerase family protein [Alphaproteobacteria bacterium]
MSEGLLLLTQNGEIATITLNRPEIHNAFNDALIAALTRELNMLAEDSDVRAVILAARGKSFCAGADLNYMRSMAGYSEAQNLADAAALAEMLHLLNAMPKPTIALVQGAAIAGGVGLISACDIAIAAESATFSIAEVRLGLIPSVISPFVINAIGSRRASRYFLTGERFDATEAERIGLVHDVVPDEALQVRGDSLVKQLLQGGPLAQAEIKSLIDAVRNKPIDADLAAETARRIAHVRVSTEAREGMSAFLEKRQPNWQD